MSRQTKVTCRFDCGRPVKYSKLRMCHACYQAVWKWRQRSVRAMANRVNQLNAWAARMGFVMQPQVVRPTRRRRA